LTFRVCGYIISGLPLAEYYLLEKNQINDQYIWLTPSASAGNILIDNCERKWNIKDRFLEVMVTVNLII